MTKFCSLCGHGHVENVIYFGLPGRICLRCFLVTGPASWVPIWLQRLFATDHGFAFWCYRGGYLPALWHWLRYGPTEDRHHD
ncbi:hypothetical protein UFOVP36_18 [uncultured Caudovirales phage]|uniref:Uncharacterized protein n=1 Tax=uncultured Caudovirales phage TaxID=2100421 RepID=A0A6J5KJI8_9CAUD|nr:hypothetical protein UFOVP36_18 [uncultured Caudovirales phage]